MSRTSDCSSLNKSSDLDLSRNTSSNTSNLGSSPAGRSRSFSITDILSDEVGSRKRSPPDADTSGSKFPRTEHIRTSPGHHGNLLSLPLRQTGGIVMATSSSGMPRIPASTVSPTQTPLFTHGCYSQLPYPNPFIPPNAGFLPFPLATPYTYALQQHMANSRYATSHLVNGGTTYDGCGLLSTSSVREQMAQMKLNIQLSDNKTDEERNMESVPDENSCPNNIKKASTPTILKRDKKKKQEAQPEDTQQNLIQSTPEAAKSHRHLITSPTSTFSPSIFLSRPPPNSNNNNMAATKSPPSTVTAHTTSPTGTDRDGSEGEGSTQTDQFVTSTPIRRGEKASFVSPTHLRSPIMSGKKQKVQQENLSTSEYSSCSDSEMPLLRRPKVPRRRTGGNGKVRTSLSPLLENTNPLTSPLGSGKARPSSLLTSYTAHHGNSQDSGIVLDHTHPLSDMSSFYGQSMHSLVPAPPTAPPTSHTGILRTPVKTWNPHLMAVSGFPVYGHSPVTDHLNRTGQIQSVPPWFVCTDRKSDGKRLRLTEAINKSMAESPSQKPQLPPEWQKFAYGQTDDQKDLTSKARSFLRCRPRVLKFEGSSPS